MQRVNEARVDQLVGLVYPWLSVGANFLFFNTAFLSILLVVCDDTHTLARAPYRDTSAGIGCGPFWGGDSGAVHSLFAVAPIGLGF